MLKSALRFTKLEFEFSDIVIGKVLVEDQFIIINLRLVFTAVAN